MGAYGYNRNAFSTLNSNEMAATYCKLIVLELALKERLGYINDSRNGGHDLPKLLQEFLQINPALAGSSALTAQITQLRSALSGIWCQGRKGTAERVPAHSYPNIRYLRHQSDGWGAQYSGTAELSTLSLVVSNICTILRKCGVML